uniref:E-selectin n=1 Tax=Geotrypetes seraphini TaxID=260995 RepID=A0A6P8SI86_GEOSA|nr:P-selectin [Geotrypetes seraphini]
MPALWYLLLFSYGLVMLAGVKGWTYHFSNFNMTYEAARKWCQTQFTDMVAIQNREENEYLNQILPFNPTYYWIGIRKIEGQWTWVGTNKVLTEEAQNWAANEPNNKKKNEDCVEIYIKRMKDESKWNDESCMKAKVALCYTAACDPSSCSGHGDCVETINSYQCKCDEGFYGDKCQHVVSCLPVEVPELGFMECSHPVKNFSYRSSCQFGCERGYELSSPDTVQCMASGSWTASVPTCQAVECGGPKTPDHGAIDCSHPLGDFRYSSTCTFTCAEGFALKGSNSLQCGASGQWSGKEPECEVVKCEPITADEDGSMSCTQSNGAFTYNTRCNFTCNEGFMLTGAANLQCTAQGQWTSRTPTCQAVECGVPKASSHGAMDCSHPLGDFLYNSTCTFTCDEGFDLKGSNILLCGAAGQWSGKEPECEAVQCEALTAPEKGLLNCSHPEVQFRYGSVCEFQCTGGWRLNGSSTLECDASGTWTSTPPTCEAPPPVEESLTNITVGVTATGASVLSMASLLMWLVKQLRKKGKKFQPSSSYQSLESSGVYQSNEGQATYYKITLKQQSYVRRPTILTSAGVDCWTYHISTKAMPWEEARNFCQNNYTDLVAIQNKQEIKYLESTLPFSPSYYWIGIRKIEGIWTWVGTKKTLTSEAENWAKGEPNNMRKKEDCVEIYIKRKSDAGKWNDDSCMKNKMALCYTASCTPSSCSGHGECVETINNCTCKCDEGFYGSECQYVIKCETLSAPAQVYMNCSHPWGNFSFGSVCEFGCLEGWVLDGPPQADCRASGQWTGIAKCEVINCETLYAPAQGYINCSHPWGNFSFGSVCEFGCLEGWELNGPPYADCRVSGQWSDSPKCEASIRSARPRYISVATLAVTSATAFVGLLLAILLVRRLQRKGMKYIRIFLWRRNLLGLTNWACIFHNATFNVYLNRKREGLKGSATERKAETGELATQSGGRTASADVGREMIISQKLHVDRDNPWRVSRLFLNFAAISCGFLAATKVDAWTYHYDNSSGSNWEEARRWCKTQYTDMVAIQNKAEIAYLDEILPYQKTYYWIGIRKIKGIWTWVGTNKSLTTAAENWAKGEPNNAGKDQDCVEIYIKRSRDSGKWNDERCNRKKAALCFLANCQQTSCSQQGECIETIGNYTCDCYPGFYGPECEYVVKCESFVAPTHGGMNCSHMLRDFNYNSSCHFGCDEGFLLTGAETVLCTASGEWTAPSPTCKVKQCKALALPDRALRHCTDPMGAFSYFSICEFSCEWGFILNGSASLRCTASGEWTAEIPTCQGVQCGPLVAPAHGGISCSHILGDFQYNSSCSFGCAEGFFINGPETVLCMASGDWTAPAPSCKAVSCKALQPAVRGKMLCSHPLGNFSYLSTCEFSCEEGFLPTEPETLQCSTAGDWTSLPPECEAVKCSGLEAPDRGTVDCSHFFGDFTYNSSCLFSCEDGFELEGSRTLACETFGNWTAAAPSCHAVRCPVLETPDRGFMDCSHFFGNFTFNTSCEFSCDRGFVRDGSRTLKCASLGNWTTSPPSCHAVRCPRLEDPENGLMNCSNLFGDFTYNSSCDFSCEDGFVRDGSRTLECTAFGNWTSPPPLCHAVRCPRLEDPENGLMNCSNLFGDFTYNSSCDFSCEDGFVRDGSRTLECTAFGNWTSPPPLCHAVRCPHLEDPENGLMNCSNLFGDFTYNSSCDFSCEDGFVRDGSGTLECTAFGNWTSPPPLCHAMRCPHLEDPERGVMNCSGFYGNFTYNSSCDFSCEDGFVREGSGTLKCTALGNWNSPPPSCHVVKCPELMAPDQGIMNCSHLFGNFTYNSSCDFSCQDGFIRNGPRTLDCTLLGKWTAPTLSCQAVKCPALEVPPQGLMDCTHSFSDFTYNSTCNFSCEDGFLRDGPGTVWCTMFGNWTALPPSCRVMACSKLSSSAPRMMNCSHPIGSFSYRSICNFHCSEGYALNGTESIECQPSGQWSNRMPLCRAVGSSFNKQVLYYTGGVTLALVTAIVSSALIAFIVKRLRQKEGTKKLLNSPRDPVAPERYINRAYEETL